MQGMQAMPILRQWLNQKRLRHDRIASHGRQEISFFHKRRAKHDDVGIVMYNGKLMCKGWTLARGCPNAAQRSRKDQEEKWI